jgi:hypothetical protein
VFKDHRVLDGRLLGAGIGTSGVGCVGVAG